MGCLAGWLVGCNSRSPVGLQWSMGHLRAVVDICWAAWHFCHGSLARWSSGWPSAGSVVEPTLGDGDP